MSETPTTTSDDRAQAALQQLLDALNAAQAEHERLRATSETASQNLAAFADAVAAAADNMRAALPQHEHEHEQQAEGA
jgi:hypothetical protein